MYTTRDDPEDENDAREPDLPSAALMSSAAAFDIGGLQGMLADAQFYRELEPRLIERTFQMLSSPRTEVALFATRIIAGLIKYGRITNEDAAMRLRIAGRR